MEDLRRMYELPFVLNFISTNREQFSFPQLDIASFEECLCDSDSLLPAALQAKLLRSLLSDKEIRINSFESQLKAHLKAKEASFNPLEKLDYKNISAADKLKLLKWSVDLTKPKPAGTGETIDDILNEDIESELDSSTAVVDVGQDADNRTYWYFDDLRLYRQRRGQPKANMEWHCVAISQQDWENLIQQLSTSNDEQEQELYSYLKDQLYPPIERMLIQKPVRFKPTNDDLLNAENKENSSSSVDPAELIRSANPELTKVLEEEPHPVEPKSKNGGVAFTHQQCQLFVFSTKMANNAAEAVRLGQQESILSYHLEDPDTKAFLQAKPMKVVLPNIHSRLPMPASANVKPQNPYQRRPVVDRKPGFNHETPMGGADISQQFVPNENLTPEQLQKREDGLASLRKIHQMLLADDSNHPGSTDFGHITMAMAQDRQGYTRSPSQGYGMSCNPMSPNAMPPYMHGPHGSPGMGPSPPHSHMHPNHMGMPMGHMPQSPQMGMPQGYYGHPMSPMGGQPMMDNRPPPPYPLAMPEPSPPEKKKKVGRKRKNPVSSPSPLSPINQPIKSPKSNIPPSPLASQFSVGGPPQNYPMTPQENPMTPQFPAPGEAYPGSPGMRQPAYPPHPGPPPCSQAYSTSSNNLITAGEPVPFGSVVQVPGGNYRSSDSILAPPSHPQQYDSQEYKERPINLLPNSTINPPQTDHRPNFSHSNTENITSSSLANLAKGVEENLSNMHQQMTPSGPYGDIPHSKANGPRSESESTPSVNNTYVNTHMSIGQVNIQNVTASQHSHGDGVNMQQNVDVNMSNFNSGQTQGYNGTSQASFNPTSNTGPSVRIQNKGPNTYQYLPVSQSNALPSHNPIIPPKGDYMSSSQAPGSMPIGHPRPIGHGFPGPEQHMPMAPGHPMGAMPGPPVSAHGSMPGHMSHPGHPSHPSMSHPGGHPGGHPGPHPGASPIGPPADYKPPGYMGPAGPYPPTMRERGPAASHQYMMAQQMAQSVNVSYPSGHPQSGMVDSHQIHIRRQQMMQSSHSVMPPQHYGGPGQPYSQPGSYMPPGGQYMPPSQHMPSRPHMVPQMMMHQPGQPYMGPSHGPPYM